MENEFMTRPETLLISYIDVIKCPYAFILKQVKGELRQHYEDFIDFTKIDDLDDSNLLRFCLSREDKNIFRSIAKRPFDYDKALADIYNRYPLMFNDSEFLSMGNSIKILMRQKFIKNIYIHTEEYDKRVHLDISSTFVDMGIVKYVTGPLFDIVGTIPDITGYILADIMDFSTLLITDKIKYTNILVAELGYNYYLNEDNKLQLRIDLEFDPDREYKPMVFLPLVITEEHISSLIKK